MEKKSSKKFIIAIVALAMVLCLAVGGLVGVLAARNQEVTSKFNVQYRVGSNIAGKISAKYKVADRENAVAFKTDVEDNTATTDINESEVVAFDTTDDQHGGTNADNIVAFVLDVEDDADLQLSPEEIFVVFTYTFENTGATTMSIKLNDNCSMKGVSVAYGVTDNDDTTTDSDLVATDGFTLATGKTAEVSITVTVTDTGSNDVYYTSEAGNGISWELGVG